MTTAHEKNAGGSPGDRVSAENTPQATGNGEVDVEDADDLLEEIAVRVDTLGVEEPSRQKPPGSTADFREDAVSRQRKLEAARKRSAAAARKARRRKTGRGILFFLCASSLILALGALGGFYLFRPKPAPLPAEPMKFTVDNVPGIRFEASTEPDAVIALRAPGRQAAEKTPETGADATEAAEAEKDREALAASVKPPENPAGSVGEFLLSWERAWEASAGENGRIDPFMDHFAPGFQADGMSRAQWKADKAAKNREKDWIRIEIDGITISEPAPDGTVTVHFDQVYDSSNYSDRTRQGLVLSREADGWQIVGLVPEPAG